MGFQTLQWNQVRLTWTSGSTPYKRDIGSHKIQFARSEYSEYSLYFNFSEYIRHIRYPFPANMPTQVGDGYGSGRFVSSFGNLRTETMGYCSQGASERLNKLVKRLGIST